MSRTDAAVGADLAPAGLVFLGRFTEEVHCPLPPWRGPASCGEEHGRFDERREFLLSVDYSDADAVDPEYAWVRLRLAERWDLAGGGSAALGSYFGRLFTERFVPEFTMLSLDQRTLLNTTVWGDGTVSTIVICPDRLGRDAG